LFTFSAGVIELSITGATEPAATFFFLATLYLVLWPRGLWSFVLAGGLTGLAYLNRSSIVLYAVPLLWLIAREHREYRWKALAAFVLPAFAIVVPWLVRNIRVAGDPMFSLTTAIMARMSTPASPSADDWYQFAYIKPVSFWLSHPAWIIKKWIREAFGLWQNIADVGGLGMVFPLFVLSVLKEQTGTAERLRRWLFWIFVLHVAVLGLLSNLPRYYTIFAPFMAMYAADVMLWGWESTKARVRPVAALVFMVLAAPLMFRWLDRLIEPVSADNPEMSSREISKDNLRWLAANTPKGATLVSDIPWTVAWYADRRCAPLPPTPDQMSAFVKYHSRPDGIYLRRPDVRPGVPDGWSRWKTVFDAHAPIPGYRVARVFANRAVYYERYGRVPIGNPPAAMVPTATPRR
jgi:hypothetical protein